MKDGDELQWHFDQTDFVVSIALRDAEHGGDFEYTPLIRSRDDERYDDVQARARRRSLARAHDPDDAGHAAALRGSQLDAPRDADRRRRRRASSRCSPTTRSPTRVSTELLRRARYGRNG